MNLFHKYPSFPFLFLVQSGKPSGIVSSLPIEYLRRSIIVSFLPYSEFRSQYPSKPPIMPEDHKPDMSDFFEKAADSYDRVAPLMRDFALESIRSVPPITSTSVVHDNACGPGIVSGQIIDQYKPGEALPKMYATDFSKAMIRVLHKHSWADKITTEVMDARDLKFPDEKFSHSFTNFALMALSKEDAVKATRQLYRTLVPGGTAVVTTWKELGYMVVFHDAQKSVKPDAELKPGPLPAEWMTEGMLRDVLHEGGFKDLQIHTKRESMDSAAWVESLELMMAMVVNHVTAGWTEDEKKAYNESLKRQCEKEKQNPRSCDMVAFIAVAKK